MLHSWSCFYGVSPDYYKWDFTSGTAWWSLDSASHPLAPFSKGIKCQCSQGEKKRAQHHISVCARADLSTCISSSLCCPVCSAPMIQMKTSRLIRSDHLPKGPFIESCRMRICAQVCLSLSLCSHLLCIGLGSFRNRDSLLPDVFVLHEESKETESSNRTVHTLKMGKMVNFAVCVSYYN